MVLSKYSNRAASYLISTTFLGNVPCLSITYIISCNLGFTNFFFLLITAFPLFSNNSGMWWNKGFYCDDLTVKCTVYHTAYACVCTSSQFVYLQYIWAYVVCKWIYCMYSCIWQIDCCVSVLSKYAMYSCITR